MGMTIIEFSLTVFAVSFAICGYAAIELAMGARKQEENK